MPTILRFSDYHLQRLRVGTAGLEMGRRCWLGTVRGRGKVGRMMGVGDVRLGEPGELEMSLA